MLTRGPILLLSVIGALVGLLAVGPLHMNELRVRGADSSTPPVCFRLLRLPPTARSRSPGGAKLLLPIREECSGRDVRCLLPTVPVLELLKCNGWIVSSESRSRAKCDADSSRPEPIALMVLSPSREAAKSLLACLLPWPYCGAVGEVGDEVEDEEDSDKDLLLVSAEKDETVESARSKCSELMAPTSGVGRLPSTMVMSLSCSAGLCSRSSGGDSRGLRGGLPTIFQLSSAERGRCVWMGLGETRGGVTKPEWWESMGTRDRENEN